jgi:hypothetical protein
MHIMSSDPNFTLSDSISWEYWRMSDNNGFPEPNRVPGGLHSESDLAVGADDSPDILYGVEDDEPELASVPLHDSPFRTPHAGSRLSAEQLETDLAPGSEP